MIIDCALYKDGRRQHPGADVVEEAAARRAQAAGPDRDPGAVVAARRPSGAEETGGDLAVGVRAA
jgi:hypothetical protein